MTLRNSLENTLARSSTAPALLVVTDSHVGSTLAADFDATVDVSLLTDRESVAAQAPDSVRTVIGDMTDNETLASVSSAAVAVVALRRDRQALLVTQLLRTRFGIESVVVLLNDPRRHEAVAELATDVVCRSTCLSVELRDAIEQTLPEPSSSHS